MTATSSLHNRMAYKLLLAVAVVFGHVEGINWNGAGPGSVFNQADTLDGQSQVIGSESTFSQRRPIGNRPTWSSGNVGGNSNQADDINGQSQVIFNRRPVQRFPGQGWLEPPPRGGPSGGNWDFGGGQGNNHQAQDGDHSNGRPVTSNPVRPWQQPPRGSNFPTDLPSNFPDIPWVRPTRPFDAVTPGSPSGSWPQVPFRPPQQGGTSDHEEQPCVNINMGSRPTNQLCKPSSGSTQIITSGPSTPHPGRPKPRPPTNPTRKPGQESAATNRPFLSWLDELIGPSDFGGRNGTSFSNGNRPTGSDFGQGNSGRPAIDRNVMRDIFRQLQSHRAAGEMSQPSETFED